MRNATESLTRQYKRVDVLVLITALMLSFQATAESEFDLWMKQQSDGFSSYQEKHDREFSSFLEADWKAFQLNHGAKRDEVPKPITLPKAPEPVITQPLPNTPPENLISVKERLIPIVNPPIKKTKPPRTEKTTVGERIDVEFLGSTLPLYLEKRVKISLGRSIDNKSIAIFWDQISSSPYPPLIEQINNYRNTIEFNDWGTIQLVKALANTLYRPQSNEARLFSWFLLVKSGYAARIGYTKNRIHLMLPSQTKLFGMPYFTYDQVRYYVITSQKGQDLGSVFSYEGSYPDATRKMNLYISSTPSLKVDEVEKVLKFSYANKQHEFSIRYDKNAAGYFKDYPATQLSVYFKSTLSGSLKQSLLLPLGQLVEGQSEQEAVNILLRFVQTAFDYKTDDEQFGREKYFFPEELFLYDYSDCEDRSVLFAYLVQTLLGLEVVAVTFPGHVATAVHFNSNVSGTSVTREGKKYLITDPTYINANVGMIMPQFKDSAIKVISINRI
ncbi:MAG: hypothetical protein L3J62_09250 [Gammaproteobacteria bacterium]|nr:hypothetical protein [Gammaproteobacteria bacterium]MCF6230955.1 hypothetical protein [Gammaproteobacteria bacterium]